MKASNLCKGRRGALLVVYVGTRPCCRWIKKAAHHDPPPRPHEAVHPAATLSSVQYRVAAMIRTRTLPFICFVRYVHL